MKTIFTILLSACCLGVAAPAPRPNVVFILADDLGVNDLSLYGSKFFETPRINALARRGMKFTSAYSASPLCSPTRSSVLSGLYPARLGITAPDGHLPKVVLEKKLNARRESAADGRPWVVANDEQNPAGLGVPPDPGYKGHDGIAVEKQLKGSKAEGSFLSKPYTMHDVRKLTLWGSLLAGGAGVEYYFGYQLPENDLICEDFRNRDKSWDYCRIALDFFRTAKIPFAEMTSANALIGNTKDDNSKFCFAKPGELYLVYLPNGGGTELNLTGVEGTFELKWFNPREGGALRPASPANLSGGAVTTLAAPDQEDWLAVIKKP